MKKMIRVKIISDDELFNEVYLNNIIGINLWEVRFNIFFNR